MTIDVGHAQPPPLTDLVQQSKLSLFLDFDGTLVDLAATPDAVIVPPDLRDNLHRLNDRLDGRLAIITGRPLSALDGFLGPNHIKAVGSHGGEYRGSVPPLPPLSEQSLESIIRLHRAIPNLYVEHKPFGVAIHYRQEPDAASRVYKLMEQISINEQLVILPGKMLYELAPAGTNKGEAVKNLLASPPFAGSIPYFIGDDVTDEAGFGVADAAKGAGVLVGEPRATRARFRLTNPQNVLRWLEF